MRSSRSGRSCRSSWWATCWPSATTAGTRSGTACALLKVDDQQFKLVLGLLVLALMLVEAARQRCGWMDVPHQKWFLATIGIAAGVGTVVGNAAGPVMSIYLVSHGMVKHEFMGT